MQNVANIIVTSARFYDIQSFVVFVEMQSRCKQIENDNLCYNHEDKKNNEREIFISVR